MSQLAKRTIQDRASVLDLGCGRGFLGRWLRLNGYRVHYAGIDRVAEAVAAARRNVPDGEIVEGDFRTYRTENRFDVVTAIEISVGGVIDNAVLETAQAALGKGGTFVATIHSLDGRHVERIDAISEEVARRFASHAIEDWTEKVAPFAAATYRWWLTCDAWRPEIVAKTHLEARAALDAIERGRFHYTILLATS